MKTNFVKIKNINMNKEEFIALIESMEENCEGYGEDWFNEDEIIKFLEDNKSDKEVFQISIKFHPDILEYADEIITDDIEFMTNAVNEWGKYALLYASNRIKDDEIIVIEAIKYKLKSFSHVLDVVSERLRNNIEIVEFAMNCCLDPDTFEELQYASYEIKSNKSFLLKQLDNFTENFDNPVFLKYISDDLKNDAEFVKKLVEINPNSEKYLK
jgi:hypothetical protein